MSDPLPHGPPGHDWAADRPKSFVIDAAAEAEAVAELTAAQVHLATEPLAANFQRWRNVYRTMAIFLFLIGGGFVLLREFYELRPATWSWPGNPAVSFSVPVCICLILESALLIALCFTLFSRRDWQRLASAGIAGALGLALTTWKAFEICQGIFWPVFNGRIWPPVTDWTQVTYDAALALGFAAGTFAAARLCRMESKRILDQTAPTRTLAPDSWGERPVPISADKRNSMSLAIFRHRFLAMLPLLICGLGLVNFIWEILDGWYSFNWETATAAVLTTSLFLFVFWGLFTHFHTRRFISIGACFILGTFGVFACLFQLLEFIETYAEWRSDSHPIAAIFLFVLVEAGFLGCTYGAVRLAWLETLLLPTRFKPPKQIEEEEAHWAASNWDQAKPGK